METDTQSHGHAPCVCHLTDKVIMPIAEAASPQDVIIMPHFMTLYPIDEINVIQLRQTSMHEMLSSFSAS